MRLALVGNPNCGKTTLFNVLTGSTAHVANWPGVTFDRREGIYKHATERVTVVDLPGIYSLSPYSPEEVVSRNFIIDENPELIINIVDATNLERNLYLTTQLLETDLPIVVALNMMDIVKKNGIQIDMAALEKRLGVPVVSVSALLGDGAKGLMEKAIATAKTERFATSVLAKSGLGEAYDGVVQLMRDKNVAHPIFHGVKLLEGDSLERGMHPELHGTVKALRDKVKLDACFDNDFEAAVADARYKYIEKEYAMTVKKSASMPLSETTAKIDKLLTHKFLGIPMFALLMFIVFHLTFTEDLLFLSKLGILEEGIPSPGVFLLGWTEILMEWISGLFSGGLEALGAADWVHGLVVDGVLAGMGAVLSFLPQILILFLFLSIMEDTGYMSRAAFLMDRILQKFGLSGKAFMPLLMGFGCSVPAIMGTRTLQNDKERKLTIMLLPFFSCGAKLPIWAMFCAAIFPNNADFAVFCIYFIGIITAIIVAIILDKTLLKGPVAPFILELPAYHVPHVKSLLLHLWEKLKEFVFRATTLIAGATVIIWFLSNFSFTMHMVDPNSAESILGVIGNFLRPVFLPLGFASGADGWRNVVAIVTGLIAKEMVVSTMGVLYNPGVEGDALEDETAATMLSTALVAAFSPVAALAFMAFNLLSVPCMAAVAAANAEFKSGKWTWITIGVWLSTAWIISFVINLFGSLFTGTPIM